MNGREVFIFFVIRGLGLLVPYFLRDNFISAIFILGLIVKKRCSGEAAPY